MEAAAAQPNVMRSNRRIALPVIFPFFAPLDREPSVLLLWSVFIALGAAFGFLSVTSFAWWATRRLVAMPALAVIILFAIYDFATSPVGSVEPIAFSRGRAVQSVVALGIGVATLVSIVRARRAAA